MLSKVQFIPILLPSQTAMEGPGRERASEIHTQRNSHVNIFLNFGITVVHSIGPAIDLDKAKTLGYRMSVNAIWMTCPGRTTWSRDARMHRDIIEGCAIYGGRSGGAIFRQSEG